MKKPVDSQLPHQKLTWLQGIQQTLPDRHTLAAHPWLKPLSHRLLEPSLWHMRHEAVARGAAIGVFWAFAVPFGQFLGAAAHCVWWRGNIPVAVGLTLITNPFSLAFWLWLAYAVGNLLLGSVDKAPALGPDFNPALEPVVSRAADIMAWVSNFGAPAALGMGLFAVLGSALAYVTVKLAWRARVHFKRWRR
jgi:uncharacterized protein (DUF2062 family)